jgi:outer membrane protein assembly factor BamD (BamD/ComL family)
MGSQATSKVLAALMIAVFASAITLAQTRPRSHDATTLYEQGLKQIEAGQFEKARLSLQTLLNTYPDTALREPTRAAIRTSWIRQGVTDPDPMLLFHEGQTRAAAGKREAALLAYQTLINLYPQSDYAEKARQRIDSLEASRQ